jgi:ABC-type branched-subunit amino acid transport system ATPase component
MIQIAKIKKTGEIVTPVGANGNGHTNCIFKYNNADGSVSFGIQSVKNENLHIEKQQMSQFD